MAFLRTSDKAPWFPKSSKLPGRQPVLSLFSGTRNTQFSLVLERPSVSDLTYPVKDFSESARLPPMRIFTLFP